MPLPPPRPPAKDPRIRRHYLLRTRERGIWYPDLVGVVPGYAKTLAVFEARQAAGRARFADIKEKTGYSHSHITNKMPQAEPGWARFKEKRIRVWKIAEAEGRQIVDKLIEKGIMANETEDDKIAAEAMAYTVAVVRDPAAPRKDRMRAARTAMEFTKPKPVNRIEAKVSAEDWLSSLLTEGGE